MDSLGVFFVLQEYILKVQVFVSSGHKLCQIWNTSIVSCIDIDIDQVLIVDIVLSKVYYQESYILII
jgi:hypothetical protein